tara:strand:+ start:1279 stop:1572 length:294 start_codon:yes stop_codon:yes gene_type:complete
MRLHSGDANQKRCFYLKVLAFVEPGSDVTEHASPDLVLSPTRDRILSRGCEYPDLALDVEAAVLPDAICFDEGVRRNRVVVEDPDGPGFVYQTRFCV